MIQINEKELQTLIVCSVRYAVGRMSYVTTEIADMVKEYEPWLSEQTKRLIIEEINFEERVDNLGMSCDAWTWKELRDFLQKKK